jgi:hypothetical protein
MATNRITFKEFKKISEELKVYDNLKFIDAVLGKELVTTLEGKTMTLAESLKLDRDNNSKEG